MATGREQAVLLVGFLVLSVFLGAGIVFTFQHVTDSQGGGVDVEAYPIGPEKPTPLNSSTVEGYAVSYEERLFYNDLLASRGHHLAEDERVVANCRGTAVSKGDEGRFLVELACRGGLTDTANLPDSEAFNYSVTYRITGADTEQIDLRNYPFGNDRAFSDERR
jgi:hypothetical protein